MVNVHEGVYGRITPETISIVYEYLNLPLKTQTTECV
jgi:hypothetical protein